MQGDSQFWHCLAFSISHLQVGDLHHHDPTHEENHQTFSTLVLVQGFYHTHQSLGSDVLKELRLPKTDLFLKVNTGSLEWPTAPVPALNSAHAEAPVFSTIHSSHWKTGNSQKTPVSRNDYLFYKDMPTAGTNHHITNIQLHVVKKNPKRD